MPLSNDDVREILRLIDESDVEELRVETDGLSLYVRRSSEQQESGPPEAAPRTDASSGSAAATPRPTDGLREIAAPMLGTFYRAPAPGAAPFVEVGARVDEDTVVCLIEVMKMMNAVSAGVVGTVVEVCAANAELVDPGEPLFRIRPEP